MHQLRAITFALSSRLALFGVIPLAYAESLDVPVDYSTVQAAIDAAVDGDEVVVAPGVYHEHLEFLGKAITLRSEAGPEVTILDGNFDGRVVHIHSSEGRDSVLQGFTIRRGNASFGSGVKVFESSPTIVDNIFEDNNGGAGAGIQVSGYIGVSALVVRNIFRDHPRCTSVVSLINRTNVEFVDNLVAGNNCDGIYMYPDVFNTPLIANNTIVRNEVGMRFVSAYTARYQTIRNNLFYGNGTGVLWEARTYEPERPQWRHNLVHGNGVDYQDAFGTAGPGTIESLSSGNGNISVDPLLGGFDVGDYTPDYGSPAVDAGENAVGDFGTDLYLRPRRHDGDGDGIATIDIGAFEPRVPTPVVTLSFAPERVALGEPTTISWSSANAETCEARGEPWSGSRPTSGSEQWGSETPSRPVFQLVCTADRVARARSFELIVGDVFPVEISITPDTIADDQYATLAWSAPDATTCQASGAWSGEVGPSGSRTINHYSDYRTHTYTLNCTGATGTGRAAATVTAVPAPHVFMRFSPTELQPGDATTLTWTSTYADGCSASGPWSGELPPNGSMEVIASDVLGQHTYDITCYGSTGSIDEWSATYQVFPPDVAPASGSSGGGRIPWEFTMMLITVLARRSARLSAAALACVGALMSAPAWADSQIYIYDSDGRLIQVEYGAGEKVDYPVDEIGNRTGVAKQPPPTETAAFTSAAASPAETAANVTLTIVRSGSTATAASLTCATTPDGGTATAGSDYTATTKVLNWGIGDGTAKTCVVPLLNDTATEPNETFRVELTNASGFSVISPRFVTVTIRDDESPAVLAFTSASYTKMENTGTNATLYVSRTGGSVGTVTVRYTTSNLTATSGSDYSAVSNTLTWPDSDMNNKTVQVPVINDSTPETDEAFRVTLSSPTGNSTLGSPSTAEVEIPCNDGYECQ